LTARELNYAVQMTIDRIVFLRICEDRGIERDEQLKDISTQKNIYENLVLLFQRADARYNSGLFHFKNEKEQSSGPDSLTLHLKIEDRVLQDILNNLYYPESPYVFREIPSDILGQVYERFLGKVIRLTDGHQARIEEKPEVRKAGGVYYTPTYIVDYIVQNTVGKLLVGKTPKDVAKLKILDPACGSGTFPLGAYQYLLNWHLKWYAANTPDKWLAGKNPAIYQSKEGYKLTTAKKKEILLNNIFGADIDAQAVEVTKLSLLLKVLEGESQETIGSQLSFLQERVLPDLGKNIQCGNSLINPDYYERQQLTMSFADQEERYRVNVFDWKGAFPQVFIQGGFDAVIGNPPYIRIQSLQETSPINVEYYKKNYEAASKGNYDIYVIFVEKGLSLLNENGRLGFILPHKFFNAQYGEPLRGVIAKGKHLAKVVHFGDQQVFESATTYTCLMFLAQAGSNELEFEKVENLENWRKDGDGLIDTISAHKINANEWNFIVGKNAGLFDKLSQMPVKLENVTLRIFQGIKTSADKIYIVEEKERQQARVKIYSKEKDAEFWLEPELLHPLIKGGDSKRYHLSRTNRLLLFPYAAEEDKRISLITESAMKAKYPLTWDYLQANKVYLENREDGKMRGHRWYAYIYPKNFDVVSLPKIFTPDIAAHSSFSIDETGDCYFTGGAAGGYGILVRREYSREYILGLLNSKLLEWYLHQVATTMRGGWYSYESRFIRGLPIRTINVSNSTDKTQHDKIVSLVDRILELHKRTPRTPQEQEMLKREIGSTDRQIDRLVYELYGLTENEIKTVEGKI
jgi:type I restriction-modification system DNA methylase subunit